MIATIAHRPLVSPSTHALPRGSDLRSCADYRARVYTADTVERCATGETLLLAMPIAIERRYGITSLRNDDDVPVMQRVACVGDALTITGPRRERERKRRPHTPFLPFSPGGECADCTSVATGLFSPSRYIHINYCSVRYVGRMLRYAFFNKRTIRSVAQIAPVKSPSHRFSRSSDSRLRPTIAVDPI